MSDDIPTMTAEELGLEPEEIVVVDEAPASAKPAKEIKPEEGIEELRAKLVAEQNARRELEQHAAQASRAATMAFAEKEDSDIALVQSAIAQTDKDIREMKAAYAAAAKAGEFDKMADLAMDMQTASSNRQQLDQGLEALKERVIAQRNAPPPRPPQREVDPVEMLARSLTPASAKWVREHPECATDDVKRNKMVSAHYDAVSEGIKPDSPEYFQFVEQKLGMEAAPEARQTTTRAPQPRPQPPAAPARGNSGQGNKRVVTLSSAEREIAKMNGLTDEEYAKNKLALIAEGKITAH